MFCLDWHIALLRLCHGAPEGQTSSFSGRLFIVVLWWKLAKWFIFEDPIFWILCILLTQIGVSLMSAFFTKIQNPKSCRICYRVSKTFFYWFVFMFCCGWHIALLRLCHGAPVKGKHQVSAVVCLSLSSGESWPNDLSLRSIFLNSTYICDPDWCSQIRNWFV